MLRSIILSAAAAIACALPSTQSARAQTTEADKPVWKGPFGGTFTAGATFGTDYSYRGISQTQRQVAFQPTITYETVPLDVSTPLSAYVGAWGSNVYFPGTNAAAEIDLVGGFRYKGLGGRLNVDLGYIRYTYPGSVSALQLDFNEFGLVVGYDFGVVQLSGALRYSPNFFANSGAAWYKWAQATVPLPFVNFTLLNQPVTARLSGTIGSQYVERNVNYGIPGNDYWDWSLGATVTVYGVDLTLSYIGTNIDVAGCLNTLNCEDRVVFSIGKTF
jgi:uncharacterized protein (TIGR02001 family)